MKWHAYGHVSATKYLGVVEADTEEEAMDKAFGLDGCSVSVCHHCSREVSDPEINEVTVDVEVER